VGGEVSFAGLGRSLIGGLTTGTVLTLFVVPVFYTLFDDARAWFLAFFSNVAAIYQRS
jgi:Cu/Ag efflux pump CusA